MRDYSYTLQRLPELSRERLVERITEYLSKGGLFNPEEMDHDKVRTLLIDCREHLSKEKRQDDFWWGYELNE